MTIAVDGDVKPQTKQKHTNTLNVMKSKCAIFSHNNTLYPQYYESRMQCVYLVAPVRKWQINVCIYLLQNNSA